MDNPIQLNCSLKYNADNVLIGKDVLINIRSRDVSECAALFSDFKRQFNINLGVMPITGPQTTTVAPPSSQERLRTPNRVMPTQVRTGTCPQCSSPVIRRTCQKPGKFFGKDFERCSDTYRCPYFKGL